MWLRVSKLRVCSWVLTATAMWVSTASANTYVLEPSGAGVASVCDASWLDDVTWDADGNAGTAEVVATSCWNLDGSAFNDQSQLTAEGVLTEYLGKIDGSGQDKPGTLVVNAGVNQTGGSWSFDPPNGGDLPASLERGFVLGIKAGNGQFKPPGTSGPPTSNYLGATGLIAWLFLPPVNQEVSNYSGTWNVPWQQGLSHLAAFGLGEGPEKTPKVPLPATWALLLAGCWLIRSRREAR